MAWNLLAAAQASRAMPCVPPGKRVYAVGDIHGRADLLSALFARIDNDLAARSRAESVEIFLGDYIDRGPQSREVVELLIARRRERDALFLKGNHEDCALRFLNDPAVLSEWKRIGGINTLISYGVTPARADHPKLQREAASAFAAAMPAGHRRFLENLELSFSCGDFFFAHAGVRPGVSLHKQAPSDLLGIREDFLLHEDDFGKVVVHGHTPGHAPDVRPNRINIDTGAYATGRLTCLVLEGDRMRFL